MIYTQKRRRYLLNRENSENELKYFSSIGENIEGKKILGWILTHRISQDQGKHYKKTFPEYINISIEPNMLNFSNIEEKNIVRSLLRNKTLMTHATLIWHK